MLSLSYVSVFCANSLGRFLNVVTRPPPVKPHTWDPCLRLHIWISWLYLLLSLILSTGQALESVCVRVEVFADKRTSAVCACV